MVTISGRKVFKIFIARQNFFLQAQVGIGIPGNLLLLSAPLRVFLFQFLS